MKITYRSNNSGGSWWLKDKHWEKLEKAGWYVEWGGRFFCNSKYIFMNDNPLNKPGCKNSKCGGHRKADNAKEAESVRYLGALAVEAFKDFDNIKDCLTEFEKITGQDVSADGCDCCGPPHSFSWGDGEEYGWCSGSECLDYLYKDAPKTLREAAEKISARR